jgi:hypothetical protein
MPMSQNQPQGSTFPVRAHPHCRPQTADRYALAGLLSDTHDNLKLPNDTSFSTRCLHPSITATMTSP